MSESKKIIRAFVAALVVLSSTTVFAHGQAGKARVHGKIVDEQGAPISNASVTLVNSSLEIEPIEPVGTNENGEYEFKQVDLAAGRWICVAYREGMSVASRPVTQGQTEGPQPEDILLNDIALMPPKPMSIKVIDPDGEPVEITSVVANRISTSGRYWFGADNLPGAWRLATVVDGSGFSLARTSPGSQVNFRVEASEYGSQSVTLENTGESWTLQLRPVGSVSGSIVTTVENLELSLEVRANTSQRFSQTSTRGSQFAQTTHSAASVTANEDGTFRIEHLASGQCRLWIDVDPSLPYRVAGQNSFALIAGETTSTSIQIVKAAVARGRVTDSDGNGIAGVSVGASGQQVTTDKNGQYEFLTLPGDVRISVSQIPDPWMAPPGRLIYAFVKSGTEVSELPTIKLERARTILGRVVDEQQRPVAGANVLAGWFDTDGRSGQLGLAGTITDDEGNFKLNKIRPNAQISLRASSQHLATIEPIVLANNDDELQTLVMTTEGRIPLRGRIVSTTGKPIANAKIVVWSGHKEPSLPVMSNSRLSFDDRDFLETDSDGYFVSTHSVIRYADYQLDISAVGHKSLKTDAKTPSAGGELGFGEVRLTALRTLSGVVTDIAGEPLSNAAVWTHGSSITSRPNTITNNEGEFTLVDVPAEAMFVFANRDDYRLGGNVLASTDPLIQISLVSLDETPSSSPSDYEPIPLARRQALAKGLLEPWIKHALATNSNRNFQRHLRKLARVNQASALEWVQESEDPVARTTVLSFAGNADETVIESRSIEDLTSRVLELCLAAKQFEDVESKQVLLSEAVVNARQIVSPSHRAVYLAITSEALFDAGDMESAEIIARLAADIASKLPANGWDSYARGIAAECIAVFDLEVAWKLLEPISDYSERIRHEINIAHELGEVNPAGAEWVINQIHESQRTGVIVRVVSRMARTDVERALSLLEKTSGLYHLQSQALGYGAIAVAIHESDPDRARGLLRKAFDSMINFDRPEGVFEPALQLLEYARYVDPDSLEEYGWYTLSLHAGPAVFPFSDTDLELARHERICEQLLVLALTDQFADFRSEHMAPICDYFMNPDLADRIDAGWQGVIYAMMLLHDPDRFVKWVGSHAGTDSEPSQDDKEAFGLTSDLLCSPKGKFHEAIIRFVYHRWVIGTEDYDSQSSD